METEYPCVKKNGPEVYLQLKFSTKNCQVGFEMGRKKSITIPKYRGKKYVSEISSYLSTVTCLSC